MYWTTVDNVSNEILKVEFFPPSYGNYLDFVESGQTAYEGNYPSDLYDFNGTSFIQKDMPLDNGVEPDLEPFTARPTENLIVHIIKQLNNNGVSLPIYYDRMLSKRFCINLIRIAAGSARSRSIPTGFLSIEELHNLWNNVKTWRDGGSLTADIPRSLQIIMTVTGDTAEIVATSVESDQSTYLTRLEDIMEIVYTGEKAVNDATDLDFKTVAQTYIDQLNALYV